jgi:hypothetical protein
VGSASGNKTVIDTSPDGTNWTIRVAEAGPGFYRAAYGAGTFVAVGNSGAILKSGDTTLSLIQPELTGGSFVCKVTNGVGQESIVQASTNLTAWVNILTNISTAASLQFQDATATNFPLRFYRAVVP